MTAILKAYPENDIWLGLRTDDTDDNYKWADGIPVDYTNWAEGQPDGDPVREIRPKIKKKIKTTFNV